MDRPPPLSGVGPPPPPGWRPYPPPSPTNSSSNNSSRAPDQRLRVPFLVERALPSLGHHHLLMIISGLGALLFCPSPCVSTMSSVGLIFTNLGFLLAGCVSSNSLSRLVYIAQWTSNVHNLQVRVGYFGVCARSTGEFFCSSSISTLQMVHELQNDSLSTLVIADRYRNDVIYPGLLYVIY